MNEYIAGIFLDKNYRSTGIGTQLLTCVKQKYDTLSLSVHQNHGTGMSVYRNSGLLSADRYASRYFM